MKRVLVVNFFAAFIACESPPEFHKIPSRDATENETPALPPAYDEVSDQPYIWPDALAQALDAALPDAFTPATDVLAVAPDGALMSPDAGSMMFTPDGSSVAPDAPLPDAPLPDAPLPDALVFSTPDAMADAPAPDAQIIITDGALYPDAAITPDASPGTSPDGSDVVVLIPDAAAPDAAIPDAPLPPAAICGNGIAEGEEECDGADVLGQLCEDFGPTSEVGILFCSDECRLNFTQCALLPAVIPADPIAGDPPPALSACYNGAAFCGTGSVTDLWKTVGVVVWAYANADVAEIHDRIDELNERIGQKMHIHFDLWDVRSIPAEVDEVCSADCPTCPNGYVPEDQLFDAAYEPGALNIYTVQAAAHFHGKNGDLCSDWNYPGGWSHQPCQDGKGPIVVGEYYKHAWLQEPGHCFGLPHTFEDQLCDTPEDPGPCWMSEPFNTPPCCTFDFNPNACTVTCTPSTYSPLADNVMDYYWCDDLYLTNEQGGQARGCLESLPFIEMEDEEPPCTPEPEICDTLDQDCDGNISEGACSLPHATATTCQEGECVATACASGWGNCNWVWEDGCEASLATVSNCGACSVQCSFSHASAACQNGACVLGACVSGWNNCDSNTANGCETSGPCPCPDCQNWNGSACVAAANGTACASDSNACTNDTCSSGGCVHTPISCTTPPAAVCVSTSVLRTYSSPGTCSSGSCSYPSGDTTCAYQCQNGQCIADPCASMVCNDGNSCTTDSCQNGSCVYTQIGNDCGSRVCGNSPSGCYNCGSCASGQTCSSDGLSCQGGGGNCTCGANCNYCWCNTASQNNCPNSWYGTNDGCDCGCQWTDPDCSGGGCSGVCTPGQTQEQNCEDPSPYISYCVFSQQRTCTSSCTWGSWGACTGDTDFAKYGNDLGTWCGSTVCITLTSCSGSSCSGYISGKNGGTFVSTDAIWQVVGDDGEVLAMPSWCYSYYGVSQIPFSFATSELNLTSSSTYRGVRVIFWGGNNCVTNPAYYSDYSWVERCY